MSFWRTYYHLVWTTKHRAPIIETSVEQPLYAYLISRAAELEVFVYTINGWFDHVHLVAAIPPKHAIATVVKHLKGASAHFANHELQFGDRFEWQRGYGVLSLGERQLPLAEAYVRNQKQHHAQNTTSQWLEYAAEFDAGPEAARTVTPSIVHEEPVSYTVLGNSPF